MAYDQDEALEADIDETELLGILRAERENSIGFDYDSTLQEDRERALNYYKGDVSADMPVLPNRSSVTSTDVADGVERALPDLIEIFASGDDGITFQATGAEDEDLAKQETDYVRHVIFQQNKGFRTFYTAFKDALLSKVGVFKFYWDGEPEYQEYTTEVNEVGLEELNKMGAELVDIGDTDENGVTKVTIRKQVSPGSVKIKAIPPEDFTVAEDTVDLCDTTYCAARSRSRVQDLIADGHDPEKVAMLSNDREGASETTDLARDTVDETSRSEHDGGSDELRVVEITEHYVRLDLEGTGKPQIWRIVTGNDEAVILEMEKRSRIEFSAITPYPMTHRFYGQSLADKLIEIQKWKTALIRMLNDSGYFALNQRVEVNVNKCTDDTIPALLDNQPGRPVPVNGDGAINNIESGGPAFDMLGAIEFANTVAEERTGIVRNAQGLDPDTLHDTATGAKILIGAAQKRLRMMARLFAETGIRDLFLGVHDLLRSNATMQDTIRLRNEWIEIDPQSWNRRKDVVIEIGVGQGGREEEIAKFDLFANRMSGVLEMQGGPGGLITDENLYAALDAYGDRLGIKGIERFITDPAQTEPEQEGPSEEEMAMQMEQQKFQAQHELEQQKAKAALELDAMKAQAAAEAQREQHAQDMQLAREKAAQEAQIAREKMALEAELAREKALIEASIRADTEKAKLSANRPGGSLAE